MSDVIKRCACGEAKWNKCAAHPWYMQPFRFGKKLYRDQVNDWALVHLGETITTRTRADAVVEIIRTRIRNRTYVSAKAARHLPATVDPAMPLAQLVAAFTPGLTAATRDGRKVKGDGKCDAETTATHRARLARLVAFLGAERPVPTIDAAALVDFKTSLGPISSSTWAKYRGILRRLFNKARRLGVITRSPLDLVRGEDEEFTVLKRVKDIPRTRRLMPGELERLTTAALTGRRAYDAQRLHDLIEAAVECGGRQGELGALQWRDVIDLDAPFVGGRYAIGKKLRITAVEDNAAKTGEPREVPTSAAMRAVLVRRQVNPLTGQPYQLDDYCFGSVVGERLVFPRRGWEDCVIGSTGHAAERITSGKGRRALTAASKAVFAGVKLHFHDIRRECASRWWDSGLFQITELRDMLGHATVEQTETYLGIQPGSTRTVDAMAAFDAARAAREALARAVGSGDHNAITTGEIPTPTTPGVRLVKGRNVGPVK